MANTEGNFCKWRILTTVSAEADQERDPNKAKDNRDRNFIYAGGGMIQPVYGKKLGKKSTLPSSGAPPKPSSFYLSFLARFSKGLLIAPPKVSVQACRILEI